MARAPVLAAQESTERRRSVASSQPRGRAIPAGLQQASMWAGAAAGKGAGTSHSMLQACSQPAAAPSPPLQASMQAQP